MYDLIADSSLLDQYKNIEHCHKKKTSSKAVSRAIKDFQTAAVNPIFPNHVLLHCSNHNILII